MKLMFTFHRKTILTIKQLDNKLNDKHRRALWLALLFVHCGVPIHQVCDVTAHGIVSINSIVSFP